MPSESEVSQGAALHPPAFEKAGAKLYYGVIKAWTKSLGVPLALDACRRGSAESQVCRSLRSEAELVCRYQWETGLPFPAVFRTLTEERLRKLHADYAELPPAEVVQKISVPETHESTATNLARIRRERGLSQAGLAKASGVTLRSIQQYEQRKKDISHAQARSVLALAQALSCTMEELLENEES